jgi:hypothetical protein
MTQAPAGWYPQEDGRRRYWDGSAWTNQVGPAAEPGAGRGRGSGPQSLRSLVSPPTEHDPDALWQAVGRPLAGVGGGRYKLTRH